MTTGVVARRIRRMSRDDLLTAGQVAQRGGVHRTTVHHWAKDGKLPTTQVVNGIRLFSVADVDAFLADRSATEATRAAS